MAPRRMADKPLAPRVVWTAAARKKVHVGRGSGAPAAPAPPPPSRPELYARLRAFAQSEDVKLALRRVRYHAAKDKTPPPSDCLQLMERVHERFRDPDDSGRVLDLELEAASAVLLGMLETTHRTKRPKSLPEDIVDHWIAAAGPAFALEATFLTWTFAGGGGWVGRRQSFHYDDPDDLRPWIALRRWMAHVDEEAYAAARATAARLREEAWERLRVTATPRALPISARCALSFVFPAEPQWAAEDATMLPEWRPHYSATKWHPWCLLGSLQDPCLAEAVVERAGLTQNDHRGYAFSYDLVEGMGGSAVGPLAALCDNAVRADGARVPAEALTLIESPEVARFFAERLDRKHVGPIGGAYLNARPALALAAVKAVAATKPGEHEEFLMLLERTCPAVSGSLRGPLEVDGAAPAAAREEAPLEQLPEILVRPPWRKAPKLPHFWDARALPRAALRDGRVLPVQAVQHLGELLASSPLEKPLAGIALVREACEPSSLEDLVWTLFEAWQLAGSPARHRWAMLALGHFGGDSTARRLALLMKGWPGESAHARAVVGLDVLAAIGSDVALMKLDWLGRKSRFPALREQAARLISLIAHERGLGPEALADRLVPDLGLDASGSRTLDLGSRTFRVGFDEHLAPFVTDAAGRRHRSLPRPGRDDDREKAAIASRLWKELRHDVDEIAAHQVRRLETAMCRRRRWSAAEFRTLFVEHPLMGHLARRVVWGWFTPDQPTTPCRVCEDGTLADGADRPSALPRGGQVLIPHPVDLGPDETRRWSQILSDYQILQPFPQLERELYAPTEEEETAQALTRLEGTETHAGRLLALQHRGWCAVVRDAPQVERELEEDLWARILHTPAIDREYVADEQRIVVGRVEVVDLTDAKPKKITLGALDPIVFTEIVRDLMTLRL